MIVRKAVIPIAGLGTRHFPASHAVKKELFPVVGSDGIARALFHYHLLELEAAGVEEICIIVQPGAGEMVLLGLGDHLFRGKHGGQCGTHSPYRELADTAKISAGKSVSAVNRISAAELKGYGTIAGTRRAENPRLIDVSLIIEKPAVAVAREKLRVDGLPGGTWLGWVRVQL